MTLQELEHIFRFQITATEDFIPKDTVEYLLISGEKQTPGTCPANSLAILLTRLTENKYEFEGYRDRTPIFIIPDTSL